MTDLESNGGNVNRDKREKEIIMTRWMAIVFLGAFVTAAVPAVPAKAVSCTYETCMSACQKAGGGNKLGGCSGWCDKTIRERQQSGVCKAK